MVMGDAETEAEAKMLTQSVVPLPDCEIIKVGHHGSKTSSSTQFLNLVKPELAIYSSKTGNSYGHPHQETIVALDSIGAKIYGTDIHGNIAITTNGQTYDIQLEKQAPPIKPSSSSIPTPSQTQTPTITITPPSTTPSTGDTVYITRTGKKYHRSGCRYLSKSKIPIELTEAIKRYSPCSVCRP